MFESFTKLTAALVLGATAACNSAPVADQCPELPDPGPDAIETALAIELRAGEDDYELGDEAAAKSGARFSVSKLKMYVSDVELRLADGGHAHGQLLDESGAPLSYGVALVDAERPSSLSLNMRVPAGEYSGIAFSVGVPSTCSDGETTLNHADASTMTPPLDVDSDMYWSWDPGYVFFKVEGRVDDDGQKPFFYHVGEEPRLMRVEVDGPVVIDGDGSMSASLVANVAKLFEGPDGAAQPDLLGEDDDRKAHGGPNADQMKKNVEGSGFLSLEGGAQ